MFKLPVDMYKKPITTGRTVIWHTSDSMGKIDRFIKVVGLGDETVFIYNRDTNSYSNICSEVCELLDENDSRIVIKNIKQSVPASIEY